MAKAKQSVGVNKLAAVRKIVGKHGKDIMPSEIVKIMKSEYGADIGLPLFYGPVGVRVGTIVTVVSSPGRSAAEAGRGHPLAYSAGV